MTATIPTRLRGSLDRALLNLPFYEPAHRTVADSIEGWCSRHQPFDGEPGPDDVDSEGRRILRSLAADGWFAPLNPPAGHREPGDYRTICLIREALAYADDLADLAYSIQALAATPILRHGTDEQRRRHLPAFADGTVVGSFAVSEEHAGSDVAAVALRADQTATGWLLNGHKAWIAHGTIADLHCVIARTGPGPGALGLSAFLVPATAPGIRVGERIRPIAPRAMAHLHFEDCHLPADALLGRQGAGFVIAMEVLDRFRLTVGAAALGFARRAVDAALGRARDRAIYGSRLLDLATVKASFADMEVQLNAAALLVTRAAWEIDRGNRRFARHSSIAKLHATETAQRVVDACVQIFGAAGLVQGSVPERLYRQIRSLRVYEGTSEVQRATIAESLNLDRATPASGESRRKDQRA
ncbi:acyl-CoA dehydrogenase [Micromonospora sp. HNM0581]|uniref:acyl-CoA dehydrogenase family protein n=1 Tax=Micromonospora sp. HNM0581 TaxID=2716341 RepID=UPI00146A1988|nr:acyl-CoA dehydrogenase family protein [Micromonospora sp. HNM0581]NLU80655.1 acyl-CoA dehydrogenase [Micromonospora sp. HNM0581]